MKDFKFEFTEEQKETIRKKLCHDDIHDIIDYLEVVCADAIQSRADADDPPQMTRAQRKAMANWIMRSVPSIPMSQLDMAVDSMWNTIYPPKQ